MHNLNDMLIFAKVAQTGGFTAAANVLGLPKSNISRRVANLETELDVRLLERSTRKIRLTEIGEIYFRHCEQIIEEAEQAELSVNKMLEGPRGILRVSTSVTTGQQLLTPLLADFLSGYPELRLQLELSNRRIDLIEEGFDMAIRIGKLTDSRLVSRRLGSSCLYLYASNDYLERMGTPTAPQDLTKHRCLLFDELGKQNALMLSGVEGEEKVTLKAYVKVNDFQSLYQLACDGMGIAMLPHYMCKEDNSTQSITRILPEWSLPKVDIHAVYPSHRGTTPKLRLFLDYLIEKFSARLNC
jgi:DNA-binding transcriptional LysR family regulator